MIYLSFKKSNSIGKMFRFSVVKVTNKAQLIRFTAFFDEKITLADLHILPPALLR